MIPASFGYRRAGDLADALGVLAAAGPGHVTVLAGGQSLLPALKARTATAALLLDIGHLAELSYVQDRGTHLAIGATTRHHRLATDGLLAARAPLLAAAARQIADPQIRHLGTCGGSFAHADPAADLVLAALALDGSVELAGPGGRRVLPVADFVLDAGRTALRPDELIVELRIPPRTGPWSYHKFHRNALDWAIVGVAAATSTTMSASAATSAATSPTAVTVALCGLGPVPVRAAAVEAACARGAGAREAAGYADAGTRPRGDHRAGPDYRRHLARVLVRDALLEIGVPR